MKSTKRRLRAAIKSSRRVHRHPPAAGLFDELIVDNFAGGGGASIGIEQAAGRAVDIAINHDASAVEMHRANHPHTRHMREDVFAVNPRKVTGGRRVGLVWFSPDCKHFSRAKGAKPVDKKIRGLAWVAVKWAKAVRMRMFVLENVREFEDWGPLDERGMPCPKRRGFTFKRFIAQLTNLGYAVEWRILNAADYGAPTHRRRLFIIGRCDGAPIVWPEATHGPGRALAWRTAAECIDWTIPCPSIFERKKPLAEKTQRRIAMGIKRYVLENPRPFIVHVTHAGDRRAHGVDEPLPTVTGAHRGEMGLVAPSLIEVQNASSETGCRDVDRPAHTVTANPKGGGMALAAATLVQTGYGERDGQAPRAVDLDKPLGTVVAGGPKHAAVTAFLSQFYGSNAGKGDIDAPAPTVTADGKHTALVATTLVGVGGRAGQSPPCAADEPVRTITGKGDRAIVAATLVGAGGPVYAAKPRPLNEPIGTVMAESHAAIAAAHLVKFRGDSKGVPVDGPLPTITSGDGAARPAGAAHALGIAATFLARNNHGEKQANGADEPAATITSQTNKLAVVYAWLMKYFGCGCGQVCTDPLHTVTTKDRFGLVTVDGIDRCIGDIGLRMLMPRELARAQGFPEHYILTGTKSNQVAKIGNSVSPPVARAVVLANCAERRNTVTA